VCWIFFDKFHCLWKYGNLSTYGFCPIDTYIWSLITQKLLLVQAETMFRMYFCMKLVESNLFAIFYIRLIADSERKRLQAQLSAHGSVIKF